MRRLALLVLLAGCDNMSPVDVIAPPLDAYGSWYSERGTTSVAIDCPEGTMAASGGCGCGEDWVTQDQGCAY